jgi:hypothetical protein
MGLPACQERILSGIETVLRQGEPHLASRFAIFTRLAGGEELPRTEQLVVEPWPRRWLKRARLRAVLAIPAALIALTVMLFVASITGSRTCPAMARSPRAVPTRWDPCTASGGARAVAPPTPEPGAQPRRAGPGDAELVIAHWRLPSSPLIPS